MQPVVSTIVMGGIGYGVGLLVSKISNISPLFAVVTAVQLATATLFRSIVQSVAKEWPEYKVSLIILAGTSVIQAAAIVSLAVLGILPPLGIGLMAATVLTVAILKVVNITIAYRNRAFS